MLNTRRLYLSSLLAHLIPETRGYSLKRKLYRWSGVKVGENVRICSSVKILGNASLTIGDNTWIGPGTFIMCSGNVKVSIGKNGDIAPQVEIVTGSHYIDPNGEHVAGEGYNSDIIIEDGCWLCTRSTVLGGTIISDHSILASGSIAKGSYPRKSLLVGILATVKSQV